MHTTTLCMNIGKKHRQNRLIVGLLGLGAGVVLSAILLIADAAPVMYGIVFMLFFSGMFGVYQYLARTCVMFAMQGVQGLGEDNLETESMQDKAMLKAVRRQAVMITLRSALSALAMTAAVLLLAL